MKTHLEVNLDLPWPAFLPREYVPGQKLRIEVYRRLARIRNLKKLDDYAKGSVNVVEIDLLRHPQRDRLPVGQIDLKPERRTAYLVAIRRAAVDRIHVVGPTQGAVGGTTSPCRQPSTSFTIAHRVKFPTARPTTLLLKGWSG